MKHFYRLILIPSLLLLAFIAKAQVLPIQYFDQKALLGHQYFNDMAQDSTLSMWFATNRGLLKYDAATFEEIKLPKREVAMSAIAIQGKEVVALGGSVLYHGKVFNDSLTTWQKTKAFKLIFSHEDLLYLLASHQVSIYRGDSLLNKLTLSPNDAAKDMLLWQKNLYIGYRHHIVRYSTKTLKETGRISLQEPLQKLRLISGDPYYFSDKSVFSVHDLQVANELSLPAPYQLNDAISDINGDYWIATKENGLLLYNGLRFTQLNSKNGAQQEKVFFLKEDFEKNIWVGAFPGVSLINKHFPFYLLENEDTKAVWDISQLVPLPNNQLVVVDENGQLTYFEKYKQRNQLSSALFKGGIKKSVSSAQTIWLLSSSGNLVSYNKETGGFSLVDRDILAITESRGVLYRLKKDRSIWDDQDRRIAKQLTDEPIVDFYKTEEKWWYLSKNQELINIDPENHQNLHVVAHGVHDVQIDSLHNFWVQHDTGLSYLSSKTEAQTTIPQLQDLHLISYFVTKQNDIWISTPKEIKNISYDVLKDTVATASTKKKGDFATPIVKDSLAISSEQAWGAQNPYLPTTAIYHWAIDGRKIWLGGFKGVFEYDPLRALPETYEAGIGLSSLNTEEQNLFSDTPKKHQYGISSWNPTSINLNHDNAITFEAWAIAFNDPEETHWQYALSTSNEGWIDKRNHAEVSLSNLPPGHHTLRIRAVNSQNIASKKEAIININVAPPIWNRTWFYFASIGLLLIVGLVTYRSVVNSKDNRAREIRAKLDHELQSMEKRSHEQILKAEKLKQLNDLIMAQKEELELKNKQIEGQKYELSLTNEQIKEQKDLLQETGNKLKASINYAKRIQSALMTTEVEIKKNIPNSFVFFEPRDVVSGDFFWFKKLKHKEKGHDIFLIAAVDCTGHGVPGAFVSVVGMNLLNTITLLKGITEPAEVLTRMNEELVETLRINETSVNDGMDMVYCKIDMVEREVQFAGAKNPLYVIRNGESEKMRGDKFPIGGQQHQQREGRYTTQVVNWETKDDIHIYMTSDGYQDQFGGKKGYKFLSRNFQEMLIEVHQEDPMLQKQIMADRLKEWMGDYPQTDDILVMGLKLS